MIYLASTSPRRKTLLRKAGLRFKALRPDYQETRLKVPPSQLVRLHALGKARACVRRIRQGTILAADTLVYLSGELIGKPRNLNQARRFLGKMQGRWHRVYTGVAVLQVDSGKIIKKTVFFEMTKVLIKKLTANQIESYFKRVHPLDKAGAYAIQSRRGGVVRDVKGSFSNAVGLPMEKLKRYLK